MIRIEFLRSCRRDRDHERAACSLQIAHSTVSTPRPFRAATFVVPLGLALCASVASAACADSNAAPAAKDLSNVPSANTVDPPAPPEGDDPDPSLATHAWKSMTSSASIAFAGRSAHAAIFTGRAMIVGFGAGDDGALGDAASYDPETDTWTKLDAPPIDARMSPLAAWTGDRAIVWGGYDDAATVVTKLDGALYDPVAADWTHVPDAPFASRTSAIGVWSQAAHRFVVWGGERGAPDRGSFLGDGAAFDPATATWTMIASAPLSARAFHQALATDAGILVYGGLDQAGNVLDDAAIYDPVRDVWQPITVPSSIAGRAAAASAGATFFGGRAIADGDDGCPHARNDGLRWTGSAFVGIDAAPFTARADAATTSVGDQLFVFGGFVCEHVFGDGATWNASAGWHALPTKAAPSPRRAASAVSTGEAAIVWGGVGESGHARADGARYVP